MNGPRGGGENKIKKEKYEETHTHPPRLPPPREPENDPLVRSSRARPIIKGDVPGPRERRVGDYVCRPSDLSHYRDSDYCNSEIVSSFRHNHTVHTLVFVLTSAILLRACICAVCSLFNTVIVMTLAARILARAGYNCRLYLVAFSLYLCPCLSLCVGDFLVLGSLFNHGMEVRH